MYRRRYSAIQRLCLPDIVCVLLRISFQLTGGGSGLGIAIVHTHDYVVKFYKIINFIRNDGKRGVFNAIEYEYDTNRGFDVKFKSKYDHIQHVFIDSTQQQLQKQLVEPIFVKLEYLHSKLIGVELKQRPTDHT